MKLGDVLKKEREGRDLSPEEVAERLDIDLARYQELEAGESSAEEWGPRLARLAIALETPTSRLLAESGRFEDTESGQAGRLIQQHRERREMTPEALAEAAEMPLEDYVSVEEGNSPLEEYGPLLLGFAEAVEQPVFNLFYPCGLPFQELDDYP